MRKAVAIVLLIMTAIYAFTNDYAHATFDLVLALATIAKFDTKL